MRSPPSWKVVFKKPDARLVTVTMPGGLSEPEAVRNAALKAPKHSTMVRIYREDPLQQQAQFERTLDSVLRSA